MRNDSNTSLVFRASEKEEGGVWGSIRDLSLDTMVKLNHFTWTFSSQTPCQGSKGEKGNFDLWSSLFKQFRDFISFWNWIKGHLLGTVIINSKITWGSHSYPQRPGFCRSPASRPCTGSSVEGLGTATLPEWNPQPHPQMSRVPVIAHSFYSKLLIPGW